MNSDELLEPDHSIANDMSPEERRAYERHLIDFYIRISDEMSGSLLGDVVDISLGGMKLMSGVQVPIGGTHRLRMDLAMESGFNQIVSFEATTVWSSRCEDGKHFYTGLQYNRPTAELLKIVDRIIAELGG